METNPFAEEVRSNPFDDTPRLIYADFLDDHGDPQGELIRVQVALAKMESHDPARAELEMREHALIEDHGQRWLEPLRKLGAQGLSTRCFQRGMIERVRISAGNFLQHGEALCQQLPALHTLAITELDDDFVEFSRLRLPEQIRGLDFSVYPFATTRQSGRIWSYIACLEQVCELTLRMTGTNDGEIGLLCQRDLSRLQRLDLASCILTATSATTIATTQSLANLTYLNLSLSAVGDKGASSLARSPYLHQLRHLDLASAQITNTGATALAQSQSLIALEYLNLRANQIKSSKFSDLESYPHLRRLTRVDTRNNPLPPSRRR